MIKFLMTIALAVALSGCGGSNLDTSAKQGVAFCTSFDGVMQKMILFRSTGNLDAGDILQINRAAAIIEPYCTSPTPDAPEASIISALDVLLLIQLNQGGS